MLSRRNTPWFERFIYLIGVGAVVGAFHGLFLGHYLVTFFQLVVAAATLYWGYQRGVASIREIAFVVALGIAIATLTTSAA